MAQVEADRDELLLGTVVEVALEPATLVDRRADDPAPRPLDLGELPPHLDPEPGDLDREPGADEQVGELVAYGGPVGVHDGGERQVAAAYGSPAGRLARQVGYETAMDVGVGVLAR